MNISRISKKYFCLIFFIMLLLQVPFYSQSPRINETLKNTLSDAKTAEDSVTALCRLSWNSSWSNPDLTYRSSIKALDLVIRIKNFEKISEIYDAAALGYLVKGDVKNSRNYYTKALNIGYKYNLPIRIAWENYNLADLSYRENKFKEAREFAERSKLFFKQMKRMDMVIQSDLFIERTKSGELNKVRSITAADSLNYKLSIAKTASDSASILCWWIWSVEKPDNKLILKYALKALDLSERISNNEKLSEVYDAAALAYRLNMKYKEAREFYHKALTIGKKYNLPNRIAWESYNLANLSVEERKLSEAVKYAIESRRAFKILNNIEMVITNDWILINGYQNNFLDSTLIDIKNAIKLSDDQGRILNYYFNIIYLYGKKENKAQSMLYAMKALEIAEAMNNQQAILSAYFQIADYLRDYQHNYEVALLYYNKILEIYKHNKDQIGIAGVLNEIGNVQKLLGYESLAQSFFNQSLGIAVKINHSQTKVNAYKNIGEIFYLKRNYPEALKYFLKSYETDCLDCSPLVFHRVLIDLGNVYLNIKDYKNASKFYYKSLSLADSINAGYEKAVSYSALADLYTALKNSGDVIKYYHNALEQALSANSLSLQKEISFKLSKVFSNKKDYENAYKYLALSNALSDSLNKISIAENLSRLETKFEFQNLKAQKENELRENKLKSDSELRKQLLLKYFFIFAFILTSILGIVIYHSFQRKKRDSLLLEQQNKQIEEMAEHVHKADLKRLNFFTNISHEFRTPLTLILGPTEKLIKENLNNSSLISMLNMIRRNTLHLFNLINQLLDIRKLDTSNIKLKTSEDDIISYCKGITSNFVHFAEEKNIKFNVNPELNILIGFFDKDIIEKILDNLLLNAFKYTPAGGEINFVISPIHNSENHITHVNINVNDNGRGIPENQVQFIFDRYYQVENTDNNFNTGTGIGLAYTKELVELHKGEINVESKHNSGTKFTVIIPIDKSYYTENELKNSETSTKEVHSDKILLQYLEGTLQVKPESNEDNIIKTPEYDSKVMLVVDDNPDLREFIKTIFMDEYKIYEASDGESGYKIAGEFIPDIIISDVMMPGINGLDFSQKIKGDLKTSHIPILMLTAKTGDENQIEGLKSGADDYLEKPFNSDVLRTRIKGLIASRELLKEHFKREFLLNPEEINLNSSEDEFLVKAIKFVEENISNPDLNIEMLINELAVSRTQLFRKLKALTNLSASHFIRNIRLKKAASLLLNKSYNVTDVVYMTGFNSPSYFATCFKEMYGCLPKEYSIKAGAENILSNSKNQNAGYVYGPN